MAKVSLHVYDITNSPSERTNNSIIQINNIFKDGIGVGGIFHGAIEVFGEEWSFGYCERGSGVFSCPPGSNPMYTYRDTIELGVTALDQQRVAVVLTDLTQCWEGRHYDLLQRNCNHFCDELAQSLGAGKIPGWVNRFANMGESAAEFASTSAVQLGLLKTNLVTAGETMYRCIWGTDSPTASSAPPVAGSKGSWVSTLWTEQEGGGRGGGGEEEEEEETTFWQEVVPRQPVLGEGDYSRLDEAEKGEVR